MKTNTFAAAPSPTSLHPEQIIDRILSSGKITAADRAWFLTATRSNATLTTQQLAQIQQVFDRLRMGLLKVVD
ncbi:hypothetical protein [Egbenema bharatensis]|uniref:hypothetical protein n=1 Tax=Egbenema bharatensis TaxID=3463334 RepID=UPI003A892DAF